jgi:ribosomal protein L22
MEETKVASTTIWGSIKAVFAAIKGKFVKSATADLAFVSAEVKAAESKTVAVLGALEAKGGALLKVAYNDALAEECKAKVALVNAENKAKSFILADIAEASVTAHADADKIKAAFLAELSKL